MRLDKYLSSIGYSRKDAVNLITKGEVKVNSETITKKDYKINENSDIVSVKDKNIIFVQDYYIMLNKPAGVLSSTQDNQTTVIDILPEQYKNLGLFPVGRLDKETEGLLILTTDGELCHKLTSPKHEKEKVYYFETADNFSNQEITKLEEGITLKDGFHTKPCKVKQLTQNSGEIAITEGKYHQVRRMFGAIGNKITYLKRISENGVELDKTLQAGECRELTKEELEKLKS